MAGTGLNLVQQLTPEARAAKEDAWTAHVRSQPEFILKEEQTRLADEKFRKGQITDLTAAVGKQQEFAGRARGKSGTILTGPLGGLGASTAPSQVPGQKTILGF
jgi:hypothetical protein